MRAGINTGAWRSKADLIQPLSRKKIDYFCIFISLFLPQSLCYISFFRLMFLDFQLKWDDMFCLTYTLPCVWHTGKFEYKMRWIVLSTKSDKSRTFFRGVLRIRGNKYLTFSELDSLSNPHNQNKTAVIMFLLIVNYKILRDLIWAFLSESQNFRSNLKSRINPDKPNIWWSLLFFLTICFII